MQNRILIQGYEIVKTAFITSNAAIGVKWICTKCRPKPCRIELLTDEVEKIKDSIGENFNRLEQSLQRELNKIGQSLGPTPTGNNYTNEIRTSSYSQVLKSNIAQTNGTPKIIPDRTQEKLSIVTTSDMDNEKEQRM